MGQSKADLEKRRDFIRNVGILGSGIIAESFIGRLTNGGDPVIKAERDYRKHETRRLQKQGRTGIANRKWVLVIDLARCGNSRQCINTCQKVHQLKPEQYHLNTLLMKDSPQEASYFMPKQCQHCDEPPCVDVCPVNASFKRSDGIVLIDNEACIGCRICLAACTYSARVFNWFDPRDKEKYENEPYNVELNVPQKRGTASKCTFSADKIREGELPYCVTACPNGVYWFGDEIENAVTNGTTRETVRLSDLLKNRGGSRLLEEMGQKPRVYYLPPVNRTFPAPEKENELG